MISLMFWKSKNRVDIINCISCEKCGLLINEYNTNWCLAFDVRDTEKKQCKIINKCKYEYDRIIFPNEGTC